MLLPPRERRWETMLAALDTYDSLTSQDLLERVLHAAGMAPDEEHLANRLRIINRDLADLSLAVGRSTGGRAHLDFTTAGRTKHWRLRCDTAAPWPTRNGGWVDPRDAVALVMAEHLVDHSGLRDALRHLMPDIVDEARDRELQTCCPPRHHRDDTRVGVLESITHVLIRNLHQKRHSRHLKRRWLVATTGAGRVVNLFPGALTWAESPCCRGWYLLAYDLDAGQAVGWRCGDLLRAERSQSLLEGSAYGDVWAGWNDELATRVSSGFLGVCGDPMTGIEVAWAAPFHLPGWIEATPAERDARRMSRVTSGVSAWRAWGLAQAGAVVIRENAIGR